MLTDYEVLFPIVLLGAWLIGEVILTFKLISGAYLWMNSSIEAVVPGALVWVMGISFASGVLAAGLLNGIDQRVQFSEDAKAFAIAMFAICLAITTHSFQLSPAFACMIFGMSIRQSGMKIPGKYQDFGSLGKLSVLFLFVYLSSRLDAKQLIQGLPIGICIVVVRVAVKTLTPLQFATALGCGKRKAFLVGLGMWPVSSYAMSMLEQAKNMGVDLLSSCPPLVTVIVLLEILGPIATNIAIGRSREDTVER
jgi:Kef-type K+ transport system membrane component KefB